MSLTVERRDRVVVATIDRPEVHNALNADVLEALGRCVTDASNDGTRCVIVTGAGTKAFCAGADLQELQTMTADAAAEMIDLGQRVFRSIEMSPVPVITAVNGLALGGGFELVLASTFPLLSERAELGLPESRLGLIPGYGGTQRLPRVVGPKIAAHLMLTDSRIDAQRAYALGLTPLPPFDPAELIDAAHGVAEQVTMRGPRAVRSIGRALSAAFDAPSSDGLALEAGLAALAIAGSESDEGISAFLERRIPEFEDL